MCFLNFMVSNLDFYKSRFGKIGASEIAGIIKYYADDLLASDIIDVDLYAQIRAMHVYKTAHALAKIYALSFEEYTEFNQFNTSKIMKAGQDMEDVIFHKWHASEEGRPLYSRGIQYESLPLKLIATTDYVQTNGDGPHIVEIKHSIEKTLPMKWSIQVQTQLLLSGLSTACLVQENPASKEITHHMIVRHEMLQKTIINVAKWFWEDIAQGKIPEAEDHKSEAQINEFLTQKKAEIKIQPDEITATFLKKILHKQSQIERINRISKDITKQYNMMIEDLMQRGIIKENSVTIFNEIAKCEIQKHQDSFYTSEKVTELQSIKEGDLMRRGATKIMISGL